MPPKPLDFSPLIWAFAKPVGIFLIIVVIGLAVIAAIAVVLKKHGFVIEEENNNPYGSKKPLTDTEQKFYHRLAEALPECIILAQVQLSSIISINKLKANENYLKLLNPILKQSVDFLVCLKDFTVVAAIELDDKSHWGEESKSRDEKKNKNLNAAGITLIRWHAEDMPSIEEIKQEFHGGS